MASEKLHQQQTDNHALLVGDKSSYCTIRFLQTITSTNQKKLTITKLITHFWLLTWHTDTTLTQPSHWQLYLNTSLNQDGDDTEEHCKFPGVGVTKALFINFSIMENFVVFS